MNNEIMREEILTFIEKNSRVDLKELAIIVGTDEVTVANEMAAMEKERIICGYHTPVSYTHLDVYKRQIQTLIKNFPEAFDITAGGKGHVYQVQGNDALVEPAVELVVAVLILPRT